MFKGGRMGACVGVASVRRELVEVAEIDRFNGRRKKAEYDEPVRKRRIVNHTLRKHGYCPGLPIDTGVLGSTSVANSRLGVGTYDRSEMGDSCLTTGCAEAVVGLPVREVADWSSCRE